MQSKGDRSHQRAGRACRILFEKPEEFWNLHKLQDIYKTDRLPSLREILAVALGVSSHVPSRSELADEAFEKFIATTDASATRSRELKTVFVSFLLDGKSRSLVQQGQFAALSAHDANLYGSLKRLENAERASLVSYLQTQVPLRDFELAA